VLDVERARRLRLAGSLAVLAMLVTIAFTYSRGALLALAVAAAGAGLAARERAGA
jgi:hypothetical protein